MSDRYGFDFNNDGKVDFEESHLTYEIERNTARNNSGNYNFKKNTIFTGWPVGGTIFVVIVLFILYCIGASR